MLLLVLIKTTLWRTCGGKKAFLLPGKLNPCHLPAESLLYHWFSWITSVCDKQSCDNVVILYMEKIGKGISKLSKLPVDQALLLKPLKISVSNESWGHWQASWNQVADATSFYSGHCHFSSLFLYAAQRYSHLPDGVWNPSKARGEVISSEGALPLWFVSTSCSSQVASTQG